MAKSGSFWEYLFPPPAPTPPTPEVDWCDVLMKMLRTTNLSFIGKVLVTDVILLLLIVAYVLIAKLTLVVANFLFRFLWRKLSVDQDDKAANSAVSDPIYFISCLDIIIVSAMTSLALFLLAVYCILFLVIHAIVYLQSLWGLNIIPG